MTEWRASKLRNSCRGRSCNNCSRVAIAIMKLRFFAEATVATASCNQKKKIKKLDNLKSKRINLCRDWNCLLLPLHRRHRRQSIEYHFNTNQNKSRHYVHKVSAASEEKRIFEKIKMPLIRPSQLAEFSHREFDPDLFSHMLIFFNISDKSAVFNILWQNDKKFNIRNG